MNFCSEKGNLIELSSTGVIKSFEKRGRASVLIESDSDPDEFLLINIFITPIFSIFLENSYKVSSLFGLTLFVFLSSFSNCLWKPPPDYPSSTNPPSATSSPPPNPLTPFPFSYQTRGCYTIPSVKTTHS